MDLLYNSNFKNNKKGPVYKSIDYHFDDESMNCLDDDISERPVSCDKLPECYHKEDVFRRKSKNTNSKFKLSNGISTSFVNNVVAEQTDTNQNITLEENPNVLEIHVSRRDRLFIDRLYQSTEKTSSSRVQTKPTVFRKLNFKHIKKQITFKPPKEKNSQIQKVKICYGSGNRLYKEEINKFIHSKEEICDQARNESCNILFRDFFDLYNFITTKTIIRDKNILSTLKEVYDIYNQYNNNINECTYHEINSNNNLFLKTNDLLKFYHKNVVSSATHYYFNTFYSFVGKYQNSLDEDIVHMLNNLNIK